MVFVASMAPLVGVLVYAVFHGNGRRSARFVDGVVYVGVPALVIWHVLPGVLEGHGHWEAVAAVAGLGAVTLVERLFGSWATRADDAATVAGVSGFALHGLLEGAAFSAGEGGAGLAFGAAVGLHKAMDGLAIWWVVRPRHGVKAASLGVGVLMASTGAGYLLGASVDPLGQGSGAELYQAFVAGTLLHVVFHQGRLDHQDEHCLTRVAPLRPPGPRGK